MTYTYKVNMAIYENSCCCFCCYLPATSPCSVTKLWGGGVPTSFIDWSEPRLCCLLLRSYFTVSPDRPSYRQTYLRGRFHLLSCPLIPPVLPPHRIILMPGILLPMSHHNYTMSSHYGVLCSPGCCMSQMPLSYLLPYLSCCLLPTDTPSCHDL